MLGLSIVKSRTALVSCVLAACGGTAPVEGPQPSPSPSTSPSPTPSPSKPPDLAGPLFDPAHLVEVAIEIAPADWDALRAQTRTASVLVGQDCLAQPFADPFTWFSATVRIDGQRFGPVAVRKKGFLGSLSEIKPSLKIKLTEFDPTLEYLGLENFTLNNSIQDPSFVRTCLAYRVHEKSGNPAPRCNYADVTVNGEHLGIYLNVETVKKPYLRRFFDRDDGTLWEGTVSDFRPGWMETFELKSNQPEGGARARLEELRAALETSDAEALSAISGVIDLPAFLRFWAVESIIGHWDGYPGNANNFFVYDDPSAGRMRFLPWGPDAAFTATSAPDHANASVLAVSALPHRPYGLPAARAKYLDTVRQVMVDGFDETDLLARLDQARSLIEPHLTDRDRAGFAGGLDWVRHFLNTRRRSVMREVGDGGAAIPSALRDSICLLPAGDIDARFSTTWGTHPTDNMLLTGTATVGGTLNGHPIAHGVGGAAAGFGVSPDDRGEIVLLALSVLGPNNYALVYLVMPPMSFGPGSYPIDGNVVRGALLTLPPGVSQLTLAGFFIQGSITIDQGSTASGAPIVGRVQSLMIRL
ncbi:MAG: CotH kinase family protein [Myxococcota bacterium]